MKRQRFLHTAVTLFLLLGLAVPSNAAMNDYCVTPPFVAQSVPPLLMLVMGRDHKLYYQAYNDASDLNSDGKLDIEYTHSIDYYGYFDPYKCYTYASTGAGQFNPEYSTSDKFCNGSNNHWSGNVLNWLTMSRMDVLRKVLYGGKRVTDSNVTTVLERAFIPQDAHSWGKEMTGYLCNSGSSYTNSCYTSNDCATGYSCVNKSKALIGIDPSDVPSTCTATAVTGTKDGLLVARYRHSSSKNCGVGNSQGMINSYEPANLFRYDYVNGFDDASLNPSSDHEGSDYNILVVGTFTPDETGAWQFAVDGDDDVEVQVNGQVVAQYLGCHGYANNQTHNGTINLTSGQTYTLVARHFEKGGDEGIRVWFKKPSGSAGSWLYVNRANLPSLVAPDIAATNDCAIKTMTFVSLGTPGEGTVVSGGATTQHLFCSTSLGGGASDYPKLRRLQKKNNRIWEWSAKERPVCDTSLGTPDDYTVRVKVCDTATGLEPNCKDYSGSKKPTGLLQKYGEGDGSKVCSKTFSKTCNADTDCGTGEGICIRKSPMYFGLLSGSYRKNESGGVLRKNISSVLDDEINANDGSIKSSESSPGNIIKTFDDLKIVGFRYSDQSYQDSSGGNCGWITDRPLTEGECRNWGNPLAEMMYESLRYFAGKLAPTTEFTYTENDDSGLNLSKPDWGKFRSGSERYKPYDIYPSCAKPFMLLLSDISPNYDSDQIPGSSFTKTDGTSFAEDSVLPQLGLGTVTAGKSLLNTLTDTIGTTESIASHSWYIGQSSTLYDNLCTSKAVSNMSLIRGLCPEEPTKRGSYYAAGLAYYGRTVFKGKAGLNQDVNTYAVALSSPVADLKIKVGGNYVTFLPLGKSVSGSHGVKEACHDRCTVTSDTDGLHLAGCTSTSYCPTNTIVNFFVDDIRYSSTNDVIYARFRVNYEDVEQGADHDMDAIVQYEICTQAAVTGGYGSCVTSLAASQLQVKVSSDYGAGSIDQVLGFIISGTTADGPYLVVRDGDVPSGGDGGDTPAIIGNLPKVWSKIYTTSGSPAGVLKNPLWYAAKWGGFDGTGMPDDRTKWAKNCTSSDLSQCDPDNYYLVVNPLRLEQQLEKAFTDILARVSSGTAASILNNSEGSGANLLQAVFYPKKTFDQGSEASWIGEMQNLWYFLDPAMQKTSIREDSKQDNKLNLIQDKVAQFYFDTTENKTQVKRFSDLNGDGAADSATADDTVDPDAVKSLWKAGRKLWARNLTTSPRTIYTGYNATAGNTPTLFNDTVFSTAATWNLLQIPAGSDPVRQAKTTKLINWLHGADQADDTDGTKYRSRKVTIKTCSNNYELSCSQDSDCGAGTCGYVQREWKLGDIISSTPRLVSNLKLNSYGMPAPNGYNDQSYAAFLATATYKNRGMVFVGGNDGMLHAFKLGILKELNGRYDKAQIVNPDGTAATAASELGQEVWAYVPKQALPYLKYLADPAYNHLYYVDRSTTVVDASIGTPSGCSSAYPDCPKTCTTTDCTWRTVLIGGMGIGGAAKPTTDSCSAPANCSKTPIAGTGYSSYFALDVTDPAAPKFLWEFYGDPATPGTLGYATTGPAIVRVAKKNVDGKPDHAKNGSWYAVFASGPTGPIDTTMQQFKGQSDQTLKLFIVDLASGSLVKTIDTGITNAFAGTLSTAVIDTDRGSSSSNGHYSDDVVYIGYVQKDTSGTPPKNTWTKGGVIRLFTKESDDPAGIPAKQWAWSKVIEDIGPVTTSITKLQDRARKTLWLYFGTGRYFYKQDDTAAGVSQGLYGVKEPCYTAANVIDPTCTTTISNTAVDCSGILSDAAFLLGTSALCNQTGSATTAPLDKLPANARGWLIQLDQAGSGSLSERVITDPVAAPSGSVFFTTFKPSADICKYGGDTLVWAANYSSGGLPAARTLQGKALMQVSTGAFEEITLKNAFKQQGARAGNLRYEGRVTGIAISGVPPTSQGLSLITNPPPVKKFLHVKEK